MSKTNTGLVEYAKAQLGRPYWWGTLGQLGSEALYQRLCEQSGTKKETLAWDKSTYVSGYDKKVHDCVGLIKGYLFCETPDDTNPGKHYKSSMDVSADGMLSICKEHGTIDTIPDILGILVFLPGHVGVYIGNGEVIEARGHRYGVVQTKLAGRGWKNWGKCPYIEYEESEDDDMIEFDKLTDEQVDKLLVRINERLAKLPASEYAKKSSAKAAESGLFSDGDKDKMMDNPRCFLLRQDLAVVCDRAGMLDK